MRKHTIEISDIWDAMDNEVLLASSFRANYNLSKKLTYIPSRMNYKLTVKTSGIESSSEFKSINEAVDRYNEVNV